MIQVYAMMGMGGIIAVMGAAMWFMSQNIDTIKLEKLVLQQQLVTCNIAQKNAKKSIERQNKSIVLFKSILEKKNNTLASIALQNDALHTKLQSEIITIAEVQNETCEDTINWMLEGAINENISNSTTN